MATVLTVELGTAARRRVDDVLAGRLHYDRLWSREEHAAVRDAWAARFACRIESLDLIAEFTAKGRSWVGLDDHGRIVEYTPTGGGAPQERVLGRI